MCKKLELPVITIGAAGARQDPTKIQITDLSKTINDKLLSRVRKKLRREYNFSKFSKKPMKIPAVFSSEIPQGDFYSENNIANCQSGMGSASFVTATFGFYAVGYVLKEVANG